MTNTFGQTIDKHRKQKVVKNRTMGHTGKQKARGDDLVPSTSTTIERTFKNVDTISLADP
jgi:hypothetical protein